jgi:hypothetical protein
MMSLLSLSAADGVPKSSVERKFWGSCWPLGCLTFEALNHAALNLIIEDFLSSMVRRMSKRCAVETLVWGTIQKFRPISVFDGFLD